MEKTPATIVRESQFKHDHEILDGAPCEWSAARGATHTLLCPAEKSVGGWGKRAAKLLKTVLYVATDESATGDIVWDKWNITVRARYEN